MEYNTSKNMKNYIKTLTSAMICIVMALCVSCKKDNQNDMGGYKYVDLGLPSGTLWATCNVGADSPEEYGHYFAWGETTTKSEFSWQNYKWCRNSATTLTKYNYDSSYGIVDNKEILDFTDDAARVNWGGNWRMPTRSECDELRTYCLWTFTSQNGVYGQKVTGLNGKSIFLPAAGRYYYYDYNHECELVGEGSEAVYWTNTMIESWSHMAYAVWGDLDLTSIDRCCGLPVRPVIPSQK